MSSQHLRLQAGLSRCEASLVPPKQPFLSILVRLSYATHMTIMHCNIFEIRPRATWGAATLDVTKQKLLWQSIIRQTMVNQEAHTADWGTHGNSWVPDVVYCIERSHNLAQHGAHGGVQPRPDHHAKHLLLCIPFIPQLCHTKPAVKPRVDVRFALYHLPMIGMAGQGSSCAGVGCCCAALGGATEPDA